MKRSLAAAALLLAALGVVALTGNDRAAADPGILSSFNTKYGTAGTSLDICTTCHTSPPVLNPYGIAVRGAGLNFAAIEDLDSDGDGFTNIQEIRALTLPGSATSFPRTTTTSSTTTTSPPTTTSTSTTTTTSTTSTTMPPVTSAGAPSPATPTPTVPADGQPYSMGEAGTAWLKVDGNRLVVTKVDSPWVCSIDDSDDDDDSHEVEIECRSNGKKVEFEAELEHGVVTTKVEMDHEDDDDDSRIDDDHDDEHNGSKSDDHDDDHNGGGGNGEGDDHDDD